MLLLLSSFSLFVHVGSCHRPYFLINTTLWIFFFFRTVLASQRNCDGKELDYGMTKFWGWMIVIDGCTVVWVRLMPLNHTLKFKWHFMLCIFYYLKKMFLKIECKLWQIFTHSAALHSAFPHYQHIHQRGIFVVIDEPTPKHHYLKSLIYIKVHSVFYILCMDLTNM